MVKSRLIREVPAEIWGRRNDLIRLSKMDGLGTEQVFFIYEARRQELGLLKVAQRFLY